MLFKVLYVNMTLIIFISIYSCNLGVYKMEFINIFIFYFVYYMYVCKNIYLMVRTKPMDIMVNIFLFI